MMRRGLGDGMAFRVMRSSASPGDGPPPTEGAIVSGTLLLVESLVRLGAEDAGEVLTLQRAAYVTEAQAHDDLNLPPLRQSLAEVAAELADPEVLAREDLDPGRQPSRA